MTIPVLLGRDAGLLIPVLSLALLGIVYLVSVALYRRFFHPLAKIPGPFLAAITHFYIVKYNLFSPRSQFYLQVEKLHQQYGKQT